MLVSETNNGVSHSCSRVEVVSTFVAERLTQELPCGKEKFKTLLVKISFVHLLKSTLSFNKILEL